MLLNSPSESPRGRLPSLSHLSAGPAESQISSFCVRAVASSAALYELTTLPRALGSPAASWRGPAWSELRHSVLPGTLSCSVCSESGSGP